MTGQRLKMVQLRLAFPEGGRGEALSDLGSVRTAHAVP